MERKVGGSYDYLCRRVASLLGLRRGGSSRDAGSARWLCRPSVGFESASHTPRGQRASQSAWAETASPRSAFDQGRGCLGTVSSEPRQDRPPWRRRVEGLGQGEKRWLQPSAHYRERRIWPEIFRRGDARLGAERRAQAQPPSAGSASGRHRRQLPKTAAPITPWSSGRSSCSPIKLISSSPRWGEVDSFALREPVG